MDFNKKLILSIAFTELFYLSLALWLYFGDKQDMTGWSALGIVAFIIIFSMPLYSIMAGILGQILFKKLWLGGVINSIGSATFIVILYFLMNSIKPIVVISIPLVFIVTFLVSCLTLLVQKFIIKKRKL